MDNKVKLPIKTTEESNKITKICAEDVYKIINRRIDAFNKFDEEFDKIVDSVHKEYDGYEGDIIIGTGVAQLNDEDKFNKEIGEEIAFKKAKINANLKKLNIINRLNNKARDFMDSSMDDWTKLCTKIEKDIEDIRKYNPDYLEDSNNKIIKLINFEIKCKELDKQRICRG